MPKPDHTPEALKRLLVAEPDLVDRIFDFIIGQIPEIAREQNLLAEAKQAVREEFDGDRLYITSRKQERKRMELAQKVLSMFNGRNATEIARSLQISRATVYRFIKQSGNRPGN